MDWLFPVLLFSSFCYIVWRHFKTKAEKVEYYEKRNKRHRKKFNEYLEQSELESKQNKTKQNNEYISQSKIESKQNKTKLSFII